MKNCLHIVKLFGIFGLSFLMVYACSKDNDSICVVNNANELRLNEIQIIASHNSYRIKTEAGIFNVLNTWTSLFPEDVNPLNEWDYTHLPFEEQLTNYNIRSLEIDIYRDPEGGLFYNRFGNRLASITVSSNEPALLEPGLKVLHIPDFDYNTHYLTFKDALQTVKNWSDDNPDHFPIYLLIEPKEITLGNFLPLPDLVAALEYDESGFQEIESEIKEVFPELSKILKPRDIKKEYNNLQEAIAMEGWPLLKEVREKIIFLLIVSDEEKEAYQNLNNEDEKLMFILEGKEDQGIFFALDNPKNSLEEIQSLVTKGYIVRTRADAGTVEARERNYRRFDQALKSGAQIISTDYYTPDPRHTKSNQWSDYSVQFEDKMLGRINDFSNNKKDRGCYIPQ